MGSRHAAFFPDPEFAVTQAWTRVGPTVAGAPAPALPLGDDKGDQRGRASAAKDDKPILDQLPPEPDRYLARGRVRLAAGWQAVAGIDGAAPAARDRDRDRDREDPDAEPASILPLLVEGQPLDGTFAPVAKHTTPPPRYTEATLLGAMESTGKTIDDEALRLAMKDSGLGTPATRAAIIETLLKRDYIVRTKQQLTPTALGISLIETLPVASLASPELTGAWEARLAKIARSEDSRTAFMADITRYVAEMVDTIRASNPPVAPNMPGGPDAAPIGRCPRCGAGVIARPREFACTGACGFTLQNRIAGRAINQALAGVLLERRRSQILRGFRSKAGKKFAAMLVLDDDGALRFDFGNADRARSPERSEPAISRDQPAHDRPPRDQPPRTHRRKRPAPSSASAGHTARDATRSSHRKRAPQPISISELACPRCQQGTLLTGSRGWGCSRWREGCRFVVWFETAGRRLSAAQLRDLVTRGKTRKARFLSDRGVELDGRLVLDPEADGGSARLEPA